MSAHQHVEKLLYDLGRETDNVSNEEVLLALRSHLPIILEEADLTLRYISGLVGKIERNLALGQPSDVTEKDSSNALTMLCGKLSALDVHVASALSTLHISYLTYLLHFESLKVPDEISQLSPNSYSLGVLQSLIKRTKPGSEITFFSRVSGIKIPEEKCRLLATRVSEYLKSNISNFTQESEAGNIVLLSDLMSLSKALVYSERMEILEIVTSLMPSFIFNMNKDYNINMLLMKLLRKTLRTHGTRCEMNQVIYLICSNLTLNAKADFVSWEFIDNSDVNSETVNPELLSFYLVLVYRACLMYRRKDLLKKLNERLIHLNLDVIVQSLCSNDERIVEFLEINMHFYSPALNSLNQTPDSRGEAIAMLPEGHPSRQTARRFSITYGGENGQDRWITVEREQKSRMIAAGTGFPGLANSPCSEESESPSPGFSPSDMIVCAAPPTPVDSPDELADVSFGRRSNHSNMSNTSRPGIIVRNQSSSGPASQVSPVGDAVASHAVGGTNVISHAGDNLEPANSDNQLSDSDVSPSNAISVAETFSIRNVRNFFEPFWESDYDEMLPVNPDCLHMKFLDAIGKSVEVLLDYLISAETNFLEYLLEYIKWHTAFCDKRPCPMVDHMKELQVRVIKLKEKHLFPYNPEPLLKRIDGLLSHCSGKTLKN